MSRSGVNQSRYERWLQNQLLSPSDQSYQQFLAESENPHPQSGLLKSEIDYSKSQKLWSEIVSDMDSALTVADKTDPVRTRISAAIRSLGYNENIQEIQNNLINYLKSNTAIVITFNASFLKNNLYQHKILNLAEKRSASSTSHYSIFSNGSAFGSRNEIENALLTPLSESIKKQIENNFQIRPRYAALMFLDLDYPIKPLTIYGSSFAVFKEVVKFNSLFTVGDTVTRGGLTKVKSHPLCSYTHIENLLLQLTAKNLAALIQKVMTGAFPANFVPNQPFIEAWIPAINIFDPSLIRYVNIAKSEYTISEEDKNKLTEIGLCVTTDQESHHSDYRAYKAALEQDDAEIIDKLSNKIPFFLAFERPQKKYTVAAENNLESIALDDSIQIIYSPNNSIKKAFLKMAQAEEPVSFIEYLNVELQSKIEESKLKIYHLKQMINNQLQIRELIYWLRKQGAGSDVKLLHFLNVHMLTLFDNVLNLIDFLAQNFDSESIASFLSTIDMEEQRFILIPNEGTLNKALDKLNSSISRNNSDEENRRIETFLRILLEGINSVYLSTLTKDLILFSELRNFISEQKTIEMLNVIGSDIICHWLHSEKTAYQYFCSTIIKYDIDDESKKTSINILKVLTQILPEKEQVLLNEAYEQLNPNLENGNSLRMR